MRIQWPFDDSKGPELARQIKHAIVNGGALATAAAEFTFAAAKSGRTPILLWVIVQNLTAAAHDLIIRAGVAGEELLRIQCPAPSATTSGMTVLTGIRIEGLEGLALTRETSVPAAQSIQVHLGFGYESVIRPLAHP